MFGSVHNNTVPPSLQKAICDNHNHIPVLWWCFWLWSVFLLEVTDPMPYDLLQWPCCSVRKDDAGMNKVLPWLMAQLCGNEAETTTHITYPSSQLFTSAFQLTWSPSVQHLSSLQTLDQSINQSNLTLAVNKEVSLSAETACWKVGWNRLQSLHASPCNARDSKFLPPLPAQRGRSIVGKGERLGNILVRPTGSIISVKCHLWSRVCVETMGLNLSNGGRNWKYVKEINSDIR